LKWVKNRANEKRGVRKRKGKEGGRGDISDSDNFLKLRQGVIIKKGSFERRRKEETWEDRIGLGSSVHLCT